MHNNQPVKMSASTNQIKWYENAEWDTPEFNSPQPCIHGAGCVFTVKDSTGKITPGCCRYVHPGEEGTGRRLFPERILQDGSVQPACVRLTGAAHQFYERRGRKIPWQEWCKQQGIAFTPNKAGETHAPVQKVPFGRVIRYMEEGQSTAPPQQVVSTLIHSPTKNQRKRANKKVKAATTLAVEDESEEERDMRTPECSPGCTCVFGSQCNDAQTYYYGAGSAIASLPHLNARGAVAPRFNSECPCLPSGALQCEDLEQGLNAVSSIPMPMRCSGLFPPPRLNLSMLRGCDQGSSGGCCIPPPLKIRGHRNVIEEDENEDDEDEDEDEFGEFTPASLPKSNIENEDMEGVD